MFPSSPPPPSASASCRSGAWESRCGLQLAWHVMKDNAVWKPLETDLHPFTGLWPVTRLSDNIHPTYSNIIQLPRTLCKSSSWLLPSVGPSVVADCSVASSSVLTCWRVASKNEPRDNLFFRIPGGYPLSNNQISQAQQKEVHSPHKLWDTICASPISITHYAKPSASSAWLSSSSSSWHGQRRSPKVSTNQPWLEEFQFLDIRCRWSSLVLVAEGRSHTYHRRSSTIGHNLQCTCLYMHIRSSLKNLQPISGWIMVTICILASKFRTFQNLYFQQMPTGFKQFNAAPLDECKGPPVDI